MGGVRSEGGEFTKADALAAYGLVGRARWDREMVGIRVG